MPFPHRRPSYQLSHEISAEGKWPAYQLSHEISRKGKMDSIATFEKNFAKDGLTPSLRMHRSALRGSARSVLHFPEKSGIYHFLINFSSGMGEWYMKVVFEVLILFSLLSLISFT